jgi:hypothetical protein
MYLVLGSWSVPGPQSLVLALRCGRRSRSGAEGSWTRDQGPGTDQAPRTKYQVPEGSQRQQ